MPLSRASRASVTKPATLSVSVMLTRASGRTITAPTRSVANIAARDRLPRSQICSLRFKPEVE